MNFRSRNDLPVFLNQAGLTGVGAEVGVQKGEFASHILSHWKGRKLYLVDAWRQFGTGLEDFNDHNPNVQLEHWVETFKATYFHFDRAVIIKELSVAAANLFPDEALDFVYIDAAHDVESVKSDLAAWYPKVKIGGLFAGHDYYDGFVHCKNERVDTHIENKVKTVVDEFFAPLKLPILATDQDMFPSWAVFKP